MTNMKTLLFLFHVLCFIQSVTSQITVVQSGPGIVKPGEVLSLTCKVTGASLTDSSKIWAVQWVSQPEGKGINWLGGIWHDGTPRYDQSMQGRLTVSRDTSKGEVYFKLTGMKLVESATYYCATESEPYYFADWGQGTKVLVTSAQATAPSVFPLRPCYGSLSYQTDVTIGCIATGFLPEPVNMKWNSGTITSGIKNFPYVLQSSGTYITSSQLTIPVADWNEKPFNCNVEHPATKTTFDKKIPEFSALPATPNVKVMQASCGDNSGSSSIDLVCLITGYAPQGIKVQWLMNGEMTSISPINSLPYKAEEGTYTSTSKVSVPEADWNSEDVYTCQVIHEQSKTKVKDSIKKCSESSGPTNIKVAIFSPTPKDILITKEVKVKCVVSNINNMEGLTIKWSRSDSKNVLAYNPDPNQEEDGSYTITSLLKITPHDWEIGTTFTCKASHRDLASPLEKRISKIPAQEGEPKIYLYGPHKDEFEYDFVSVSCLMKNIPQKNVYIQWKKNGIPQGEDYYIVTEPIEEDDGTYVIFSKISIPKSDWIREALYTCVCVHNKISQKSIKRGK